MSKRRLVTAAGAVTLLAIIAVVAGFAYLRVSAGSSEASVPITAPTLSLPTDEPKNPAGAIVATPGLSPSSERAASVAPSPTAVRTDTPISAPSVDVKPSPTAIPEPTSTPVADPAFVLYRIVPGETEARFIIDETTMGGIIRTVVGKTNQVAGDIVVDFENPKTSRIGVIRINARTLKTDSSMRDQTIRSRILESARDEYEFVVFTPTEIVGLPETIELAKPVEVEIVGDLTIRAVTTSVEFQGMVKAVSAERLEGFVTARIFWPDFDLAIPFALGIVGVNKDVILEIDIVAHAVEIRAR